MVSEACPTNPREEASGLDPEAVHTGEQSGEDPIPPDAQLFSDVADGIHLPTGECECVGMQVNTREHDDFEIEKPEDGDVLLDEIGLVADISDACKDTEEVPPEEEPDVVEDGDTISFIAFVADGQVPDITEVNAIQVKNGNDADGDFDPVTVEFSGNTQLEEVVVNVGGPDREEAGLIFGNGFESGTVTTRDEDADNVQDDWLFVNEVVPLEAGQSDDDEERSTTDPRDPDDRDEFGFVKYDWDGLDDGGVEKADSKPPGE